MARSIEARLRKLEDKALGNIARVSTKHRLIPCGDCNHWHSSSPMAPLWVFSPTCVGDCTIRDRVRTCAEDTCVSGELVEGSFTARMGVEWQ